MFTAGRTGACLAVLQAGPLLKEAWSDHPRENKNTYTDLEPHLEIVGVNCIQQSNLRVLQLTTGCKQPLLQRSGAFT